MEQGLHQLQSQRIQQRLTSQQVRFVRLLEMNEQEVEAAVERELDDNPALERVDAVVSEPRYVAPFDPRPQPEWTPVAADDSETLYDLLAAQIGERYAPEPVRKAALYIIGNLDSNGYLQRTPQGMMDDLAFGPGIDLSAEQMDQALGMVRSLDPPGVGASNLRESLELQLERMSPSPVRDDALRIVREGFEAFTMKHLPRLVTQLKMPAARVDAAVEMILSLNPKPGAAVGSGRGELAAAVVPDFQIDVSERGEITVGFPGSIPALAIEESFEQAVRRMKDRAATRKDDKDARFITSRYGDARDFINILQQRRDTLYSVMTAIVKLQHDYFLSGDDHDLHPMALKDVASLIGMDVSTVSRATAGKYVATSYGIVPLRFFFSEGYDRGEGAARVSARSVQAALRALVDGEDKRHPLSDEALCAMLAEQGYDVSRRTVAKYRDRLGLPVARLRKNMQI